MKSKIDQNIGFIQCIAEMVSIIGVVVLFSIFLIGGILYEQAPFIQELWFDAIKSVNAIVPSWMIFSGCVIF